MIHEACMPVYIVIQIFLAGVHATRGSTRGPRGPNNGILPVEKCHIIA